MSEEINSRNATNWRDRAGDEHKAEITAIQRNTEKQAAVSAFAVAARVKYTAEIGKVGMLGLSELSREADRITQLDTGLVAGCRRIEQRLIQVIEWNMGDYGTRQ